jgi:trk system potassium uptake protein
MPRRGKQQEFAVIGLGRFGRSLALALEARGHPVLGIDEDGAIVQQMGDQITQAARLDATNENALKAVDITTFDTVIVAIGNDFESNLMTTVALRALGVKQIICKAQTVRQRDILLRVGADRVIQPESEAGRRLAEELSLPSVLDKLPLGADHSVAEIIVPPSLAWQSLAQSDMRGRFGITVLLIKRGDDLYMSPTADTVLQRDDIIVVLGSNESINRFSELA